MFNYSFFSRFPILELDDIRLRELVNDDANAYFSYMTKIEMADFLTENNIPKNIDHAMEELRYWSRIFYTSRGCYWGITIGSNNQLIGTAGFNSISIPHLKAEISYDLDPNFWNKGIMQKVIRAITKFLENAGIIRIQATVIQDNTRSINLLKKCDFKNEGLMKKYEIVQGAHKDYYLYAKIT